VEFLNDQYLAVIYPWPFFEVDLAVITLRRGIEKMKNRFLTIFVIIVSMLVLAGCSESKLWFSPHSPQVGVKEQWQIQGFHLSVDSQEQFTFDIGLAEKTPDYSFWQDMLS